VTDYGLLVPICVGISRLGEALGRIGFALVFVIASDCALSRKSLCDLSLTHIVLFIITDNATIGMLSWWLRARCLNLFVVIGSLALSSPNLRILGLLYPCDWHSAKGGGLELNFAWTWSSKALQARRGVEKQIRGLC